MYIYLHDGLTKSLYGEKATPGYPYSMHPVPNLDSAVREKQFGSVKISYFLCHSIITKYLLYGTITLYFRETSVTQNLNVSPRTATFSGGANFLTLTDDAANIYSCLKAMWTTYCICLRKL